MRRETPPGENVFIHYDSVGALHESAEKTRQGGRSKPLPGGNVFIHYDSVGALHKSAENTR